MATARTETVMRSLQVGNMDWVRLAAVVSAFLLAACGAAGAGDDDDGGPGFGVVDADTGGGSTTDVEPGPGPGPGPDDPGNGGTCIDNDGDGYGLNCPLGPDCNDFNPNVNPGMDEICGNMIDDNCNGFVDEGCPCAESASQRCFDGDPIHRNVGVCREGIARCEDGEWGACDNRQPEPEICDGLDNNCNGFIDEGVANDCGTCGPPPLEICGNFMDDNCNGIVDEGCPDGCGGRQNQPCYTGNPRNLGFGICRGGVSLCDDDDQFLACIGEILPEPEICDGIDNNCNGFIDEGLTNLCGQCGVPTPVEVCDGIDNNCNGFIDEGLTNLCGECAPLEIEELCDGTDTNCNGTIDEGCSCFAGGEACWPGRADQRGVGQCRDGRRSCDASGEFWEDCTGFVLPSPEICDGIDNDCNGLIDDDPLGCSVCGTDPEVCDGRDNNCNGRVDEGLRNACGQCFADVLPEELCGPACCDGLDNDCDGLIDEGLVNICGQCDGPCFTHEWGNRPSEWDDGESEGLELDTSGGLRLGARFAGLPHLWVANSGEATVSRINTETMVEEGRFPVGSSPSRTAVDFNGNVFVANRAFYGQGTVTRVNARECTDADCVQYTAPVGTNDAVPRGVAIDADGFPWVGTYTDMSLRRMDPNTGLVIESHFVGSRIYGIAIDADGIIWFTNLNIPQFTGGALGAFDTSTRTVVGTWQIPGCSNPYGVAVDGVGGVWLGNFTCNNLVRFDTRTRNFSVYDNAGLDTTRGVAVDGEGFVWVASYANNRVAKFDPVAESFVGTFPVCQGPIGVGIANDGHIWVPCYASDNVHRLAPDGTFSASVSVGRNPYSYSDLTGFQLRNFTAIRGSWVVTFDCGHNDCIFMEVDWDETVPAETDILMRARVSQNGTVWSPWTGAFSVTPVDLGTLPFARYIQIELNLRTSNRDLSPILELVSVYWARP